VIVLPDTHAYHWWLTEPDQLSPAAGLAMGAAEEIVVAAITWYELAWLARKGRIGVRGSLDSWLRRISRDVRTLGVTPSIAAVAAGLPDTFPSDPADRLIVATAMEHGLPIVSRDRRMHEHAAVTTQVIW
jgi:PIN domain nuclease of toxin-antitoxin system